MSRKSSERALWQALKKRMDKIRAHAVRIEDRIGIGTPDVNFIRGWIELKHMDAWPVYAGTAVRCGLTQQQAVWAWRRHHAGGLCWILVRVATEVFLFAGSYGRTLVKDPPSQQQFRDNAVAIGWDQIMAELEGADDG